MKKLFISQPMRGKSDEEILKEREALIKKAEGIVGEKLEAIDSFFQSAPADAKPMWFLGRSLELLSMADVAIFAQDWEKYRGCRIEKICAEEYGIERIIEAAPKNENTFPFGEAIKYLKRGYRLTRNGWNGKDQYIQLASNIGYVAPDGSIVNADHKDIGNRAIAFIGTSGVQIGWLASQADMLAEDWTFFVE